jgi:hypothetical protein
MLGARSRRCRHVDDDLADGATTRRPLPCEAQLFERETPIHDHAELTGIHEIVEGAKV